MQMRKPTIGTQALNHVVTRIVTTSDNVPPGALSIITTRPCRLSKIAIQYASRGTPISFNFIVSAANGEEIYRSPLLLATAIVSRFSASLPANTDFGLYNNNVQPVITINTASPGVSVTMNIRALYKYPAVTTF
jgi:hypothetical protein